MNKTLIAVAGLGAVVLIAYLGYELLRPSVDPCETVFQQTAPSLEGNVKFLNREGSVVLGRKQIQELSDRAQEIALNLKACCVISGMDEKNVDRFLQCKGSASRYGEQVAEAVATIKDVIGAEDAQKAARQKEAEERLQTIVEAAAEASRALENQVNEISRTESGTGSSAGQSTKAPSDEPGRIRLQAALTEGGEIVQACFSVYEPKQDLQGNRKQIDYSCTDNAVFTLPAGRYFIGVEAGQAKGTTEIQVGPGTVTEQILTLSNSS